jgi:hypothetical protein
MEISWNAPESYTDSSQLNPSEDLEAYEIFVNASGAFAAADEPSAYISATDAAGNATETFALENLDFAFSPGQTYYFCMRSVSKSGVASEFSAVVALTL